MAYTNIGQQIAGSPMLQIDYLKNIIYNNNNIIQFNINLKKYIPLLTKHVIFLSMVCPPVQYISDNALPATKKK